MHYLVFYFLWGIKQLSKNYGILLGNYGSKGMDGYSIKKKVLQKLRRVRELMEDQQLYHLPSIKKVIPENVEELLAKSTQQRQHWLVQVEAALNRHQTIPIF
jgi:hypothetical protein